MRAKIFVKRLMDLEAPALLLSVWPMSAVCRAGLEQAGEHEQEVRRYTKEWAWCHVPGGMIEHCGLIDMVGVYLCKSLFRMLSVFGV